MTDWMFILTRKLLHHCPECNLVHQVEVAFVGHDEEVIDVPGGLALRFMVDGEETERLRACGGKPFITKEGNQAIQGVEGGPWFSPAVNPFGHGCCDCKYYQRIAFGYVNEAGEVVEMPEGLRLALRFSTDHEETARLREYKGGSGKDEWINAAYNMLHHGVQIMNLDQLRAWEGIRGVIETCPVVPVVVKHGNQG